MAYVVMVDDNYHHQDTSYRYQHGEFADACVALEHCKQIVDADLDTEHTLGMSAQALWEQYTCFWGRSVHPQRGCHAGSFQRLGLCAGALRAVVPNAAGRVASGPSRGFAGKPVEGGLRATTAIPDESSRESDLE